MDSQPRNSTEAQLIVFNKEEIYVKESLTEEDIIYIPRDGNIHWLNCYGLENEALIRRICKLQEIDSMACRDIFDKDSRPKIQIYDTYIIFTIKTMRPPETKLLKVEQISFILGPNYVLSFQEKGGGHFNLIRQRVQRESSLVRQKPAYFLLYLLIDGTLDSFYRTLDFLEPHVDAVMDFQNSKDNMHPDLLEEIELQKRRMHRMKRALIPLREAISNLEHIQHKNLDREAHKFFADLKDTTNIIQEELDYQLHRLESATNLFFSLQSHNLNQVMKTLTVVSSIFIPLSFLAAIYGMNFSYMPELSFKYSYFIFIILILTCGVFMVRYFKQKKWI